MAKRKAKLNLEAYAYYFMQLMETQICKKCEASKIITDFYLRKDINKYRKICIQCHNDKVNME